MCYRHIDFWKPMDTLRDKRELEALWASGSPPWKRW
jgi:glucose-1-phosphate cytidylyltransferase